MGSHHSQCFASHQTIAPGDRCFAMAIRQQGTYDTVQMTHKGRAHEALGISHSAIYPDAYWTPVSNFIEGIYTTNGDIAITRNPENMRRLVTFVRLMLENAAVVAEGKNPSHDLAFDLPQFLADNAPVLAAHLVQPLVALSASDEAEMFDELSHTWTHVDDIAFKHRVFYADNGGRMRPLQMTLMHKRCYDDLLSKVSPMYEPKELFARGLQALADISSMGKAEGQAVPDGVRDMYASMAVRTVFDPLQQVGHFDSIEYNEEELGLGELVLQYLEGKLSKAALFKCLSPLTKDHLVIHLLEGYQIKIMPKCIWHEDSKNEYGKDYSAFVARVCESVTKGRRNKPRT